jgi:hypothetical protein
MITGDAEKCCNNEALMKEVLHLEEGNAKEKK